MICQCCRVDTQERHMHVWPIPDGKSALRIMICNWCLWMLKGFIMSVVHGHNMKIQWGNRSIYRPHWKEVKEFLRYHLGALDPATVKIIEYGAGLTTELLMLDGYDLITFEPNENYARMCHRFYRNVFAYPVQDGPPALDRRFDFALVDAPQGQSARTKEMAHAIAHTDGYIYMHDPEKTQIEVLEEAGWLPMEKWSKIDYYRFYEAPP